MRPHDAASHPSCTPLHKQGRLALSLRALCKPAWTGPILLIGLALCGARSSMGMLIAGWSDQVFVCLGTKGQTTDTRILLGCGCSCAGIGLRGDPGVHGDRPCGSREDLVPLRETWRVPGCDWTHLVHCVHHQSSSGMSAPALGPA